MFCKHNYNIIDKTTMPSAFEQREAANRDNGMNRTMRVSNMDTFFRRKVIILMKCDICKKLKKIVETNP